MRLVSIILRLRVLLVAGLIAVMSLLAASQSSPFATIDVTGAGTGSLQGTGTTSINASGIVAGTWIDPNGITHGFTLAGGTIYKFSAPNAGSGKNQGTFVTGIDTAGDIAGYYSDSGNVYHGFICTAYCTTINNLTVINVTGATTWGDLGTAVSGINTAGVVTGFYRDTNFVHHGFIRATNGTITAPIDDPNAGTGTYQGTEPTCINTAGTIAGFYTNSGSDPHPPVHGFIRTADGTFTTVDPPGAGTADNQGTTISSINANGDVVGSYIDTNGKRHGFVRVASSGTITTIDDPNAGQSCTSSFGLCGTIAMSIDTAGEITGGYVDANNVFHGFLRYANGTMTSFDDPNAGSSGSMQGTGGFSINAAGTTIAGTYMDTNSMMHGFIYTPALVTTTTTLTPVPTPNPSIFGEPVTLTAAVSSTAGAPPNGENVTFLSGTTPLGTETLSSGVAVLTTTALLGGTNSITAVYTGDANFAGSTSTAVSQVVNKASTTTTLTSSLNPSTYGQSVTLTATVSGQFGGIATGTMTFSNGSTSLGSASLSGGSASLATTALPVGTDSITAVYGGDSNFAGSTTTALSQVVNALSKTTPTVTVTSSSYSITTALALSVTVTVSGTPTPTGSVTLSGGGFTSSATTLASGSATISIPAGSLSVGSDTLTASYAPDSSSSSIFNSATGTSSAVTVTAATNVANEWTWMGGNMFAAPNPQFDQAGVYGTLGTPAAGNFPGGRYSASSWTDRSGNLWLFGGYGVDAASIFGSLNDLWEFNPYTNEWTWKGGSSTTNCGLYDICGQAGVYGTLGTAATGNVPGARTGAVSWIDSNGNLWLFGGNGFDANRNNNFLNDLWKFNPSTNQWAWMGGSSTVVSTCTTLNGETICGQSGVYGTLGTPAAGNVPGARTGAASWTDSSGNFWLFGGSGYVATSYFELNDLWEFNPSTNQWAWMGGSSTPSCNIEFCGPLGVYGTLGTPAAGNAPGGRSNAVSWTDSGGHLWLFGGLGWDANGNYGSLNDLWEFNPSTNEWAWMGGSSTMRFIGITVYGQPGVYGTLGSPAAVNIPGGRAGAMNWTDSSGHLWLFGGSGYDANTNGESGWLNDLWEFNPSTNEWAWMGGSSTAGQGGVYGTLGTPASGNIPAGRSDASTWTDDNGHLWLFGGLNGGGVIYPSIYLNDLWVYQPPIPSNTTTTTLTPVPTPNPSYYGESVTLTVSVTSSGGTPPNGESISFLNGTTTLGTAQLSSGTAVLSTTALPVGTDSIKAVYGGDSNFAGSTSTAVSQVVNKATPSVTTWPTASSITYGQTLASSTLSGGASTPAGSFAFTTPTTAPGAGTASQSVTFTPTDAADYSTLTGTVSVTVNKATPSVTTWPTASSITYGQTLASSTLSGGASTPAGSFAFTTPITAPGAGTASQSVTFTPTDTTDYSTLTGTASVTVNKAMPSVTTWPTASSITYGQTLASSTLSGGASTPAGSFAFTTPTTAPGAGTASQSVTFTPTDATDYSTLTGTASVTVNKATPSVTTWPTASSITYGQTLASSTLSGGASTPAGSFAFTTPTTAPGTGTASQSVTFTPTDTTDYTTLTGTANVTVNKASSSTVLVSSVNPSANGQSVTFTATVSGQYGGTPSGTVSFSYGSTSLGSSAQIISGVASLATTALPLGTDTITAVYSGDTNFTGSTSNTVSQVVEVPNPVPLTSGITPAFADAGGAAFTLTVNGTGFTSSSTVYWGTSALVTTFNSATQLTAQVPATDIATGGISVTISVITPSPGGGTSNSFQFEVDSSSGTTTGPTFSSVTQTVTAGSPASYPVTLPSTVESASVTCLNLPTGAACSYSMTTNTVTITTSSTTPTGTYQVTVVFMETVSGAASGWILLPFLLLPLMFIRRKLAARGVWITACLVLVLLAAVTYTSGCGGSSGGSSTTPPPQTHQAVSSGTVSITVQ
jgi:N-acetylneuraminic acid mutarotase